MFGSKLAWWVGFLALIVAGAAGLAEAQPHVYVLGRDSASPRRNQLTVVNAATNTKGPRIALGTSNGVVLPQAMVMAPDGSRVYVINDLQGTISVVATATNTLEDTWPSALVGSSPTALTVSPDGERLYVVGNSNTETFIAIDIASRTRIATVGPNLGGAFGVAASGDGSRVYMMATGSDTLAVLSTAPYRILTTIDLDLGVNLLRGDALTVSPDGRFLYIAQNPSWSDPCGGNPNCIPLTPPASARASRIAVLDTSTNAIVATTTIHLSFQTRMYHTAVSPNGAFVYATGRPPFAENSSLYRFSPSTHAVIGGTQLNTANPLPTGRAVTFLADSSRAYVAATDGVYAVDTSTHAVSATIPFASTVDGLPNAIVTAPPPPPDPPSNLRSTIIGNRVSLAWDASPSDALTGYVVEGGATPGSVLATVATGGTATSFAFDAPTGAFYVRLHALTAGGRSRASNEIRILVNVPQPPTEPTGLLGLANGATLALSWKNPATGGAPSSLVLDVSGDVTTSLPLPLSETFSFAGVPTGTYTFTVRAVNGTGTSVTSTPVTLTFPGICAGAPQAPQNFAVTRSGSQVSVSWDPPAEGAAVSSYVLKASGAVTMSLPMSTRSIGGAVPPGTYNLSVLAVNPCGSGAETSAQSVTVP